MLVTPHDDFTSHRPHEEARAAAAGVGSRAERPRGSSKSEKLFSPPHIHPIGRSTLVLLYLVLLCCLRHPTPSLSSVRPRATCTVPTQGDGRPSQIMMPIARLHARTTINIHSSTRSELRRYNFSGRIDIIVITRVASNQKRKPLDLFDSHHLI